MMLLSLSWEACAGPGSCCAGGTRHKVGLFRSSNPISSNKLLQTSTHRESFTFGNNSLCSSCVHRQLFWKVWDTEDALKVCPQEA